MTRTLAGSYSSLVSLTSALDNPTAITSAAQLSAGLEVSYAGPTVVNAGSITVASSGNGVVLDLAGSLTNQPGGVISGYYAVDGRNGALTLVNAGNIAGSNTGVYLQASSPAKTSSITNQAAGTINGGIIGLSAQGAAATVINAGTIKGFSGVGINLYAGGSVTNQTGGKIIGGVAGGGLAVVNAGSITTGATGNGVFLDTGGGSITNQTGGSIRAGTDGIYGYNASGGVATVVNAGTITGSTTNKTAAGVFLIGGASVTNQAKSVISGHDGIYQTGGAGTVTNAGSITGVVGIAFAAAATGGETVTSAGTIVGTGGTAVAFGGTGSNLLVLESGFVMKGAVVGAPLATNTAELSGTAGAPVTGSYSGTGLVNFQTIAFAPGIRNAATLAITNDLRLPGTIVGFTGPLDTINLTALADTSNAAYTSFNTLTNALTITGSNSSVQLQLDNEDYTGIHFIAQKAAAGGTEVQALPSPMVTSVTATPATADLGVGKIVTLTVSFSETVTVTGGVPTLLLNDGGTAKYTGGSGSGALSFTYTVLAGQNTEDLTVTGAALNGATIQHGGGNPANLAGAVSNPAGILQIDTVVKPTPTSSTFSLVDTTTNVTTPVVQGSPYTGSVTGVLHQFITFTSDNLDVTTASPGWYIRTGSGNDEIDVSKGGGNNVLDASTGSNLLIGGSGKDTFYLDARNATINTWNTVAGFHSGDSLTVWGITSADFTITHADNQGPAGHTGLTFSFSAAGKSNSSLTLAGLSGTNLTKGQLTVTYGTLPATGGVPGSAYMLIHHT
jgi:hypothetical protein